MHTFWRLIHIFECNLIITEWAANSQVRFWNGTKGYCCSFCLWLMELVFAMIFPRPATQWFASTSELAMRSRFFFLSLKMMEKQRCSGTSLAYFSIPSVLWPALTSWISSMETVETNKTLAIRSLSGTGLISPLQWISQKQHFLHNLRSFPTICLQVSSKHPRKLLWGSRVVHRLTVRFTSLDFLWGKIEVDPH